MTRKARIWIGTTMMAVVLFNYAFFSWPVYTKIASVRARYRTILMQGIKSNNTFANSSDEYMMEVLRRERESLDKRLVVYNAITVSIGIVILSWTVFGLLRGGKRK